MGIPRMGATNVETGQFPYLSDGAGAPYTDGIISNVNPGTGAVYMPAPGEMTLAQIPAERGKLQESGIEGSNVQYVDSYTVAHNVLAGNS